MRKEFSSNKSRIFFQVFRVLCLRTHGRILKTVWTEADDWVTALFLPICITRSFPWERPNPQLIPHGLISTVYNISHGMWCLQNKESGQPQKEKAASTWACRAEPGAQFPITSHRHKPLFPPSHPAPLAAACTQQRKQFPPSHLPWTDDSEHCTNTERPELMDGETPCRVSWYLPWSSGSSVHCQFRTWQAYPRPPMTPSNFLQQP